MGSDTKERIMKKALLMFSERGYNGTNLRDLAKELDLSKSALYRHFDSKEAIWEEIYQQTKKHYEEHFGSPEHMPHIPDNTDELYEMTMRMIRFTIHDETVIQMRKLLTTEQFRDEKTGKLASNYFFYGTESMFKIVFEHMMKQGCLKTGDVEILAFSYTTPISAMIHLCDREPDKESEALERVDRFVSQFIQTYGSENVTI